jgi:hypothetical protein
MWSDVDAIGRRLLVLALVSGCGRVGFDARVGGTGDGGDDGGGDGTSSVTDAMTLSIPSLPISGPQAEARCADAVVAGSDLAVVWTDERSGSNATASLYFTRVAFDGSIVVGEQQLSPAGQYISCPRLAWTGTAVAATWNMDLPEDVYAGIINLSGTLAPETPVSTLGANEGAYSIAWNDSVVGIGYSFANGANRSLRFAPVSASGTLLAAGSDLRVATGINALAPLPSGFAVASVAGESSSASEGVEYMEIDDTGAIVVGPALVTPPENRIGRIAFAHGGTSYLIAYAGVTGVRTAVGSGTTQAVMGSIGGGNVVSVAATVTTGGFAVAWFEETSATDTDGPLYVARVDTAGALASPIYRIADVAHSVAMRTSQTGELVVLYSEGGTFDLMMLVFSI